MNRLNKEIIAAHELCGQLQEDVGQAMAVFKTLLLGIADKDPRDITVLERASIDTLGNALVRGKAAFKATHLKVNRLLAVADTIRTGGVI